jgi:hypothetical protein
MIGGMSTDKEVWEAKFTESIVGLLFRGARKDGRGPWLFYGDLPQAVKSYLQLEGLPGAAGNVVIGDAALRTLDDLEEAIQNEGRDRFGRRHGLDAVIWINVDAESRRSQQRKIPKGVRAIRDLEDLVDYFNAGHVTDLPGRIYRDTDCGAWISLETPDGEWHHAGEDWSGISEIAAFKIGTIVEGSDETVESDEFDLPVPVSEVKNWIDEMEAEAKYLWEQANGGDEGFFEKPPGPKDWSPTGKFPPGYF